MATQVYSKRLFYGLTTGAAVNAGLNPANLHVVRSVAITFQGGAASPRFILQTSDGDRFMDHLMPASVPDNYQYFDMRVVLPVGLDLQVYGSVTGYGVYVSGYELTPS